MGNGFLNQSLHCFAISDARLDEILVEIYDTMWLGQLWLKLRRTVKYYGYLWKHALPHDFCHWFFLPPLFLTLSVSLSLSLSLSSLYDSFSRSPQRRRGYTFADDSMGSVVLPATLDRFSALQRISAPFLFRLNPLATPPSFLLLESLVIQHRAGAAAIQGQPRLPS